MKVKRSRNAAKRECTKVSGYAYTGAYFIYFFVKLLSVHEVFCGVKFMRSLVYKKRIGEKCSDTLLTMVIEKFNLYHVYRTC